MGEKVIHASDSSISLPEVSVIMNCLNCSTYLKEAIDSVYAQTYKDWEIIFWDNASTDNSAKIAYNYDNKLRYFCSDTIVPLGHARNFAIEKARGKYIAFLDCDDVWLPEKLERQINIFDTKPDVMLVYSNSYVIDSGGNIIKTTFDSVKPARGYIFKELLSRYNFIPLLTAIIKKEVLDEIGLFTNKYEIAADYDLFLRIAHKYPVDYFEQPLAKYRVHGNNFSLNMDIGIKEELEIINNWLDNIPKLKNGYDLQLRVKKLRRYAALFIHYSVKYVRAPRNFLQFYK